MKLGFGKFSAMLATVENLPMTERLVEGGPAPSRLGGERRYESPTLIVIGNLRDLLAGTGSQLSDDTVACSVADSPTLQC